jgi:integrase
VTQKWPDDPAFRPFPRVEPVNVPEMAHPLAPEWPSLEQVVQFRRWHLSCHGNLITAAAQSRYLRYAMVELPSHPGPLAIGIWVERLSKIMLAATVNNCLGYLSRAYEAFRSNGGPLANPCKLVKSLPTQDIAPGEALGGPESAEKLYESTRTLFSAPSERVFMSLIYFAALSRSEMLGLEPGMFVDRESTLHLAISKGRDSRGGRQGASGPPKTKARKRKLALHKLLPAPELAELRTYLKSPVLLAPKRGGPKTIPSPYLFPWNGDDVAVFIAKLRAINPALFPKGHALHQFRHAALEFAEEHFGGNVGKVRDLAGHASEWSTIQYIRRRRGSRLKDEDLAGMASARTRSRVPPQMPEDFTPQKGSSGGARPFKSARLRVR